GQAINLIVEHQNFQADVAAQHVNGVIAADGKRIAIASGDPDVEVRADEFHAGGDRRSAAVNGVEAENVHVIRETAGAADAGDENQFFLGDFQVGENHLHGGKDGGVAAARTPADFLVGLKIFFGVNWQFGRGHFKSPVASPTALRSCLRFPIA